MDCGKGSAFSFILSAINSCLKAVLSLGLGVFYSLFSFSALAAPESVFSSVSVKAFLLGLILPIMVFYGAKLRSKFTAKNTESSSLKKVSQEDFFSYTHDLTTNLPTAQHALKQFDQALKATQNAHMAAVVFKPINFQQVNTVLGHHNSDILLLQLAFCLKKNVEKNQSLLSLISVPKQLSSPDYKG